MKTNEKHLYNLDELSDYKVSEGYADIRGWKVMDVDNRVIGKVDNLLVNKDTQRVVYIDVEVDQSIIDASHDPYSTSKTSNLQEFINTDGENHIIIPIGLLDINSDDKRVYSHTINHYTFSNTKRYRKGENIDRAYEVQVLDSYKNNVIYEDYDDKKREDALTENKLLHALETEQIRALIREEIKNYHNNGNSYFSTFETTNESPKTTQIDPYKDENFYNRNEFEKRVYNK
ncbi:photosystem reaction center subunit H [Formosa sediminum]|uniref:Photosystem reaction center subunit H n=1 Tax=Formosa sediminum TaxID=2594004 RepID=A0A516GSH6_9FLAO|nr:PRC-barrel domain-containing protein [Formosa sediminum]QDO94471.1 photosystem reaction center subunit H [Formosa sediminum]